MRNCCTAAVRRRCCCFAISNTGLKEETKSSKGAPTLRLHGWVGNGKLYLYRLQEGYSLVSDVRAFRQKKLMHSGLLPCSCNVAPFRRPGIYMMSGPPAVPKNHPVLLFPGVEACFLFSSCCEGYLSLAVQIRLLPTAAAVEKNNTWSPSSTTSYYFERRTAPAGQKFQTTHRGTFAPPANTTHPPPTPMGDTSKSHRIGRSLPN